MGRDDHLVCVSTPLNKIRENQWNPESKYTSKCVFVILLIFCFMFLIIKTAAITRVDQHPLCKQNSNAKNKLELVVVEHNMISYDIKTET